MLGNMKKESGLRANNVQDGYGYTDEGYTAKVDSGQLNFIDSIGYGLCQWTYGPRKLKLLQFARQRGVSIGDEDMQVDFCINELRTEYPKLWLYLCDCKGVAPAADKICEEYERPEKNNYQDIRVAGRIMSRRIMGSASFFEIQDHTGRIQIYIRRDDICEGEDTTLYNTVFKKLLDIGDFVGIEGFAFITKTGELSVHCRSFKVLSKSIRPLPIVKEKDGQVYDALTDPEVRYRQRYVDLVVNPKVRDVFAKRAKIISTMREYFNEHGCLEVETPILQPIPGGASARPFITHHNALDNRLSTYICSGFFVFFHISHHFLRCFLCFY